MFQLEAKNISVKSTSADTIIEWEFVEAISDILSYPEDIKNPHWVLQKLAEISLRVSPQHPTVIGIINGTFWGRNNEYETLQIDTLWNVILTRVANDTEHLLKNSQTCSWVEDMHLTSIFSWGGNGLPTSAMKSWGKNYKSDSDFRVIGTFKIPVPKLLELFENWLATLGNISECEIVLDPSIAESYLAEVEEIEWEVFDKEIPREIIIKV